MGLVHSKNCIFDVKKISTAVLICTVVFSLFIIMPAYADLDDESLNPDGKIYVNSITLDDTSILISEDEKHELTATVLPNDATNKDIDWISEDRDIATVDGGVVQGVSAGVVKINAVSKENSNIIATCTVQVMGIYFESDSYDMQVGDTLTINPVQIPSGLIKYLSDAKWKSSKSSVVSVKDGVLTAKKNGEVKITITSSDDKYSASCKVYVVGIEITNIEDDANLKVYDNMFIKYNIGTNPVLHNDYTLSFYSSNENIAVIEEGFLNCLSPGKVTIGIRCNEDTKIYDSVDIFVSGVSLSTNVLNLYIDTNKTLTAKIISAVQISNSTLEWKSFNEEIASVDKNGVVSGKSRGRCLITAKNKEGDFIAYCTVNVSDYDIHSSVYEVSTKSSLIENVVSKTSITQFKANFSNIFDDIKIYDHNGYEFSGNYISTGFIVKLVVDGEIVEKKTIIVMGDVNGDGEISIVDYVLLRLHILDVKLLSEIETLAADANCDGKISIADYTLLRLDILELKTLGNNVHILPDVSNESVEKMLEIALKQYGKLYVWGNEGPDTFDCSGFAHYCLRMSGAKVSRQTANSYSNYERWMTVTIDELAPGDLMFYYSVSNPNTIGHVGIYLNNGYFIHSSSTYGNVVISKFDGWYVDMFSHGKRVYE